MYVLLRLNPHGPVQYRKETGQLLKEEAFLNSTFYDQNDVFFGTKNRECQTQSLYFKWLHQGTRASTRKAMTMTAGSALYPAEPIRRSVSRLTILELTQQRDLPR